MQSNLLKKKIAAGESALGTFVKIHDPLVVEVLALAGFDFFVLDNEHVAMDWNQLTNMVRAAEAFHITPIIRVKENQQVNILQALDLGFAGIQAPNVDTPQQAQALVSAVKYGPLGNRGFSPSVRACRYGTMDIPTYIEAANANTMVISHCETKTCVDNLDAILAVEGIDVIFIGPMDLSQSLGLTGQTGHPVVKETVQDVTQRVLASGKAVGTVAANADAAKALIAQGVQYILLGADQSMILNWGKSAVTAIKGGK